DASEELEQITSRLLARDVTARIDAAAAASELARLSGMPLTPQESPEPPPPAPWKWRVEVIARVFGVVAAIAVVAGVRLAFPKLLTMRVTPERHRQAVAATNRAFEALQQGDLVAARSFATSATRLDPTYGEAQLNLASVYAQSGQVD